MLPRLHGFPVKLPDIKSDGLEAAARDYALRMRAFYDSRATAHRRLYRGSGILTILVGTSLPVLANLNYDAKPIVVSLAGTAIAILTALYGFYRWDQSWVLLRTTEAAITKAYWNWESTLPDDGTYANTRAFLDLLADLRKREAKTYFKDLPFPTNPPGQSKEG